MRIDGVNSPISRWFNANDLNTVSEYITPEKRFFEPVDKVELGFNGVKDTIESYKENLDG